MKLLAIILLSLFAALQYKLWLGDKGLREYADLAQSVSAQRTENGTLERRNQALGAEVLGLKEGLEAVEERARSEMGMIKEGETFYQVIERPVEQQ